MGERKALAVLRLVSVDADDKFSILLTDLAGRAPWQRGLQDFDA
jgi:hypothetical protein